MDTTFHFSEKNSELNLTTYISTNTVLNIYLKEKNKSMVFNIFTKYSKINLPVWTDMHHLRNKVRILIHISS